MFLSVRSKTLPDGRFYVPVNVPPSFGMKDIDMSSQENQAWNVRTLTLMSRAGLIEIDSDKPPLRTNFESEEAYKKALELHRESRFICIRDEAHLNTQNWEHKVEPIRQQRQKWSYKNLQLMRDALRPKRCLSEILAEAYTIPTRAIPEARKLVRVSPSCGGCPSCRKNGITPFSGIMPAPSPVWQNPKFFVGEELQRLLAEDKLLLIFYESVEERSWKRRSNRVLKWLIEQGIRNIVTTQELPSTFIKEVNRISDAFICLFERYEPIRMPRIPTLIFHPPGVPLPSIYLSEMNTSKAPRIILLPVDTPDPDKEHRRLIDIFSGRSFPFDLFCTEISI
jgi:hypothetical protein